MEEMFMRKEEVAKVLGVSESYAYKLMHKLNAKMVAEGYNGPIISGRIDRTYFFQQFYSTRNYERRED